MHIETIDDILNELADLLYVYGCCPEAEKGEAECICSETSKTCCRVGFMMEYRNRIDQAIINEKKLENF